jgi:prolyl oligopeptidase
MFSQVDPFLWLEEVEGERALAWVRKQNERTLAELEAEPLFAELHEAALTIANATDRPTFGGLAGGHVYNFWQDETNVRGLWRRATWESWRAKSPDWQTLLDIDELARRENANWVFQGAARLDPEDPGSPCLVSLSNGGKDAIVVREFDLSTQKFIEQGFTLPEGKSTFSWFDHDTLLISTNWGEGSLTRSGYPFVVKRLRRGEPLDRAIEIFRGAPHDESASRAFRIDDGTRFHHFIARAETFFSSAYWWIDGAPDSGSLKTLHLPRQCTMVGIAYGLLLFQPQENARAKDGMALDAGSLYAATLASLAGDGESRIELVVAPRAREMIQGASVGPNGVLVTSARNVRNEVRLFERNASGAWSSSPIPLPGTGVASASANPRRREIFYTYEDLLTPPSLLSENMEVLEADRARFNSEGLVVTQHEAISSDGERIPYFEARRADALNSGQTPTLLYGYGGFKVPMLPTYSAGVGKLWLERGGAFVIANIRGGGEFGPDWHAAGLKTRRQIIYDDFIAVAETLIARGVTSPKHLGIMGGSNGGLLMGAMLAQRPEIFNAVVVQVPLLDMLRFHLLLAGASWVDEYGSPEVPDERAFLQRISPYHTVDPDKIGHVAPFFVTSTKDDRVHPGHARKLAAKLEAAGAAFYYFENIDGGHGAAANRNEGARRQALEFTYLWRRLMC